MSKKIRTATIKTAIGNMLAKTVRPLNSRVVARIISRRYNYPKAAVYGVLSGYTRTGKITWITRTCGGPSTFR